MAEAVPLVNHWNSDGDSVFWWQDHWLYTYIITSSLSVKSCEMTSELNGVLLVYSIISLSWCTLYLQMNWLGIAVGLESTRLWFWIIILLPRMVFKVSQEKYCRPCKEKKDPVALYTFCWMHGKINKRLLMKVLWMMYKWRVTLLFIKYGWILDCGKNLLTAYPSYIRKGR